MRLGAGRLGAALRDLPPGQHAGGALRRRAHAAAGPGGRERARWQLLPTLAGVGTAGSGFWLGNFDCVSLSTGVEYLLVYFTF